MAPEFVGPVIVSREPGVVRELRPYNTFSILMRRVKPKDSLDLYLTSRVPWAPQEGGGIVSGRGGELGPDFWKFKSHALTCFSTRYWLLPVILMNCWVPMPGCLHTTAQNLLPESEYISFWCCRTKITISTSKLHLKLNKNLKSIWPHFARMSRQKPCSWWAAGWVATPRGTLSSSPESSLDKIHQIAELELNE